MRDVNYSRRRFVQRGVVAGSVLSMPYASAWAQSDAVLKLLRLPKLALVVGNSAYKQAPVLKNPVNDAKAIANALEGVGFDVTLKLDANRAEMASLMHSYTQTLATKKCVGLFYFAGHGVQLAWRNYLVPVEAAIDSMDDVPLQCTDVSSLLEGISKAANPMNVIILDACRDNPFGRDFRDAQKGLSQVDAPPATLLAYATSPGHVASDGERENGLYTEHLLREIKVRDAKIEDVFKRVRLGVRRQSNGAQIPWESTSLEEDFYFLPPESLKKFSEEEKEREFKRQLAVWDRVKSSKDSADLYAFLQEYPNGPISEQAQFRLDQLDKPKVEAEPGANGVKPLTSGTNRYALGDEFTYEATDRLNNVTTRRVLRVTYADNDRVEFNKGGKVVDQLGSELHNSFGTKNPGLLYAPADIAVGKRWRTAFTNTGPKGIVSTNFWDARVVALEEVQVPAGSIRAFKIVARGEARQPNRMLFMSRTYWIDPVTMTEVRNESEYREAGGARQLVEYSSTQLVSLVRAPR